MCKQTILIMAAFLIVTAGIAGIAMQMVEDIARAVTHHRDGSSTKNA